MQLAFQAEGILPHLSPINVCSSVMIPEMKKIVQIVLATSTGLPPIAGTPMNGSSTVDPIMHRYCCVMLFRGRGGAAARYVVVVKDSRNRGPPVTAHQALTRNPKLKLRAKVDN